MYAARFIHPRSGYKIRTTPVQIRHLGIGDKFSYTHDHTDENVMVEIIAETKNSQGGRKYFVVREVDDVGGELWAIHPHYHTGVDLFYHKDGRWEPAESIRICVAELGFEDEDEFISKLPGLIAARTIRAEDEIRGTLW